jgi:LPS-assembly lipoprotein
MIGRRAVFQAFALPILALVAGCGFHPAFQQSNLGHGGSDALAQIEVGLIPDRPGQLLRQELQRRLEGSGGSIHKSYLLATSLAMRNDFVGIEFGSNSSSRIRVVGTATWKLIRIDGQQETVASGWQKSTDGFNQIDPQYFYSDLQLEQTYKRIAASLAEQMLLAISVQLNKESVSE